MGSDGRAALRRGSRYWLLVYRTAQARMAEGKPAAAWGHWEELEAPRAVIERTREAMRRAL